MNADPKPSNPMAEARTEQELFIDGCKVTVRYGTGRNPDWVDEIKSLLLAAQFKTE